MSDKNYRSYLEVLRTVRSPIDSSDVERLFATPRSRRFSWIGAAFVFFAIAGLLLITIAEIQAPRDTAAIRSVGTTLHIERCIAHANLRALSVADAEVHSRHSQFHAMRDADSSMDGPVQVLQSVGQMGAVKMSDLTTLKTLASATSKVLPALEIPIMTLPERSFIVSLRTSVTAGLTSTASVEYPVFDHLLIGVSSGLDSRKTTSSIAGVRFHDTTTESNGQAYSSTIGELVPTTTREYFGFGGVSTRWLLNDIESPWNASVLMSAEYGGKKATWDAGVSGSMYLTREYWASLTAVWRSSRAFVVGAGIEAHW